MTTAQLYADNQQIFSQYDPISTPYEYVGDVPALGGLQLTKLARSYEQIEDKGLGDMFPDETINERTVVIETVREGLGIMPIVRMGVPAGNFLEPERIQRRYFQPAFVREDDFLDQGFINQLRAVGTVNEQDPPMRIMQRRIRRLVARHNRTKMLLQAQVLQGGINYTDPRTGVGINVSTYIPTHNYFQYDGWNATLNSGSTATVGQQAYTAAKALTNNKGRTEALFFTDTNPNFAIPWTHPRANIPRCLRLLKQYLLNTNKNVYTELVMSRDLYTIIQENELIKAYSGTVGLVLPQYPTGAAGSAASAVRDNPQVQINAAGDITSIAGLNIRLLDTLYRDPVDNQIKKLWPANLVAVVATHHYQDTSVSLGFTQQCVGEAPDGSPGMWMRVGPDQMPPAAPGRTVQLGNAFLPFATYPQWICLMTVADLADISTNLILQSDLDYGTF